MREFTVAKGVMGYIVKVGCQVAGFSSQADLKKAICEYIDDPKAMEKKYYLQPTCNEAVDSGPGRIGTIPDSPVIERERNSY
jgi:hypothetical protein